eukprot:CAMPEP_0113600930 /NCGR_PEP_ID=MMETSP0015_2-20120614/42962_1 /TAXON_ID=2838 /ORGANISM="Odontella" /LENGTH=94 /DNA_ID=CAMNT_0000509205 /DNA_START=810 /DNA_END=1094 /DNA_ORIENTATION=+ /assembly_acc=CAM_ASM_000160
MSRHDFVYGVEGAAVQIIGGADPVLHLKSAFDVLHGTNDEGLHEPGEGAAHKGFREVRIGDTLFVGEVALRVHVGVLFGEVAMAVVDTILLFQC